MGEITEKIKPLVIILIIVTLLNTIPFCIAVFANINIEYSETVSEDSYSSEIMSQDSNVTGIIAGVGIFIPFVSLLNTNSLIYPFSVFFGMMVLILSVIQTFLYVVIALNMLPFFNT